MKSSFPLGKEHIEKKKLVSEFQKYWLFFFLEEYLFQHFELLMEKDSFQPQFCDNFLEKEAKVYKYVC